MQGPGPLRASKRLHCRSCAKEVAAVPMVAGEPTPELLDQARRGEIVLWGPGPTPWRWACPECRHPIASPDARWDSVTLPGGAAWAWERCPLCDTPMVWSHASWRCPACRFKEGCC
ncbi:MAG: hypothetical protein ACE5H5_02525 [Nitrospinota bacterium]